MSMFPVKNSPPFLQLLILLLLMPVSVFVVSLAGILLLLPFGGAEFWEAWMQGQLSLAQLKYLQLLQSAGLFIVPALLARSEEHTSELQSRPHLVCRLLLEKKKNI